MIDVTNFDLYAGSYNEFVDRFKTETDRAAAVLGGAYAETFLREVLSAFFIPNSPADDIFTAMGPLSTFAGRCDVAFALGLMTEKVRSDLRYIRKIRNHFAHHPDAHAFAESPVRDWCGELSTSKPLELDEGGTRTHVDPRHQFLLALGIAMLTVQMILSKQERRTQPSNEGWTRWVASE